MDEQFINKVINKYNSFRKKLEEQIKSIQFKVSNNDCYLIIDSWDNELTRIIKNYESNKINNKNRPSSTFYLPRKNLEFVNSISSIFEYINKNNKFRLISKDFIELLKEELNLNLNQNNIVSYYTGNNKLIFEFNGNENYAILLNCSSIKYYTLYFLDIKTNKSPNKDLYRNILSYKETVDVIKKKDFKDIILSEKEFKSNNTNNSSNNKNNSYIKWEKKDENNYNPYKKTNDRYFKKNEINKNNQVISYSNELNNKSEKNINSREEINENKNENNYSKRRFYRGKTGNNNLYDNRTNGNTLKKIEENKMEYEAGSNQSFKRSRFRYGIEKQNNEREQLGRETNEIDIKEKQNENLKNDIKEKDKKINDLLKENKTIQNEYENKEKIINEINKENDFMKKELKKLDEEIKKLKNENNNLQNQNKELIKSNNNKNEEIKKISNINEKNEKEIKDLKNNNKDIEK